MQVREGTALETPPPVYLYQEQQWQRKQQGKEI